MNSKQRVMEIADTPTSWESGTLGRDKKYAAAASKELGDQIDDALGLQMISIRLDKELIDTFKLLGDKYQMGYQPLIREALTRFVDDELKMEALEALKTTYRDPSQRLGKRDC
jgi:uncharacterized protein (DUF4415 family)